MKLVYGTVMFIALLATGCQTTTSLFNGKDISGWVEIGSKGSWSAADGVLKCNGKMDKYAWLSTDRKYGDFELTIDWRIQPQGNTGVFCRAPDREGRTSMQGFEAQARDDASDKDLSDVSGAVYNRIAAAGRFSHPVGEWNTTKITCKGRHLRIEINGHVTVDVDMDSVPAKGNDPPMKNIPNEGYIGLQNHGFPSDFRNIRLRELK